MLEDDEAQDRSDAFSYGVLSGKRCAECNHFVEGEYHDKRLFKCEAYGLTHSEASDWRKSYVSCGLYGKELPAGFVPMIERLKRGARALEREEIEGQLSMLEGEKA